MAGILAQLNQEIAEVNNDVQRSLVYIETVRGNGAGTIWHEDGLILTNAHVVANSPRLRVTLADGRTLPAQVLARSNELDLAALNINATGLPTIALGDSQNLQPGEYVMAVGHPWGVRGALTAGVVIGAGANLPERPMNGTDWLAMSLHLRPGHSGGPVVNTAGELVGINTIMAGPEVGVAVPVHVAKAFLKAALGSESARLRAASAPKQADDGAQYV